MTSQPKSEERKAPFEETIAIEQVTHSSVLSYFSTFNAGDFDATAELFAEDGALRPPFEDPIVGNEAIAAYLHKEATGMQIYPRKGETLPHDLPDDDLEIQVKGYVQTPIFGVNVGWLFVITPQSTLRSVRIKLLASPQELLKLRQ